MTVDVPQVSFDRALKRVNVPVMLELLEAFDTRPELRASFRLMLDEHLWWADGTPVTGNVIWLTMRNALDEADVAGEDSADVFLRRLQEVRDALGGRSPDHDEEG